MTAAGVFPLFVKMATPSQAELAAVTVTASLLKDGGIVTSTNNFGQQWDAPNGWAPLQWISITGLNVRIPMFSVNFGVSFANTGAGVYADALSTSTLDTGRIVAVDLFGGVYLYDSNLPPFGQDNTNKQFSTTGNTGNRNQDVAWNPNGQYYVHVGTKFTISTNSNFPELIPQPFLGVVHCTSVLYTFSATNVYLRLGVSSWVVIYSGSPRSICASIDGSIVYILEKNGDIVSKSPALTKFAIGTTMKSSTDSVDFVNTSTFITGTSLINIPPGVWSVSFGWMFSASSSNGDGVNKVKYGLSHSTTDTAIVSKNRSYRIFFGDITTYESYSECITIVLTTTKSLYLNALVNKPLTTTGALMTKSYIIATVINVL